MRKLTVQIDIRRKGMVGRCGPVGHHTDGPRSAWGARYRITKMFLEPLEAQPDCIEYLSTKPEPFRCDSNQLMLATIPR